MSETVPAVMFDTVIDVLDFVLRTVRDDDLSESEVRERIDRVVGKALDDPSPTLNAALPSWRPT